MKEITVDGIGYKLPTTLNIFQREIYVNLINWKWRNITKESGTDRGRVFDAILPEKFDGKYILLYPAAKDAFLHQLKIFSFKVHPYFNHMASSQAACVNLFFPILLHKNVSSILKHIKPDFRSIAKDKLDKGFRVEFWDEPFNNLNDKNKATGTDVDIAIAYYNDKDEPCLWLIEHKLTEKDFTSCGGYKSKGRKGQHDCTCNFSSILRDKYKCYYHDVNKYNYWNITDKHQSFFLNHNHFDSCPFRNGMNQLWRNQLLALSIEEDERQPYKHVFFSVVRHPGNIYLDDTLLKYQELIGHNPKFSILTYSDFINAAEKESDAELQIWLDWYKELYYLP